MRNLTLLLALATISSLFLAFSTVNAAPYHRSLRFLEGGESPNQEQLVSIEPREGGEDEELPIEGEEDSPLEFEEEDDNQVSAEEDEQNLEGENSTEGGDNSTENNESGESNNNTKNEAGENNNSGNESGESSNTTETGENNNSSGSSWNIDEATIKEIDTFTLDSTEALPAKLSTQYLAIFDLTKGIPESDILITLESSSPAKSYILVGSSKDMLKDQSQALEKAEVDDSETHLFIKKDKRPDTLFVYIQIKCDESKSIEDCKPILNVAQHAKISMDSEKDFDTFQEYYYIQNVSSVLIDYTIKSTTKIEDLRFLVFSLVCLDQNTELNDQCFMFIGEENTVPFSNPEDLIKLSFTKGYFFTVNALSSLDDLFCLDCHLSIHILKAAGNNIILETHFSEKSPVLSSAIYSSPMEILLPEEKLLYTIDLSSQPKDENLILSFSPYIIDSPVATTVYCYHEKDDELLKIESFSVKDHPIETIISASKVEHCKSPVYKVEFESQNKTLLRIEYKLEDTSEMFLLQDGEAVLANVIEDERISYLIKAPYEYTDLVNIRIKRSNKFDITVENCVGTSNCNHPILENAKPDQAEQPSTTEGVFTTKTTDSESGNYEISVLTIDPQQTLACYPMTSEGDSPEADNDYEHTCLYKLTLSTKDNSKYLAEVDLDIKGHTPIYFNHLNMFQFSAKDNMFFYVNVDQSRVKHVKFVVTEYSGQVQMYVSQTEKYPTKAVKDVVFGGFSSSLTFSYDDNENPTEDHYYIGIVKNHPGPAIFSLMVQETDEANKDVEFATELADGLPVFGRRNLKDDNVPQIYKFQLDLDNDWDGEVQVLLISSDGQLVMTLYKDLEVDDHETIVTEPHAELIVLDSEDPDFDRKGTFYVKVTEDVNYPKLEDLDEIEFMITYSLHKRDEDNNIKNENHIVLTSGIVTRGVLKPQETRYFKFYLQKDVEEVALSIDSDSLSAVDYVSLGESNQYPDENNNLRSESRNMNQLFRFTQDEIYDACIKQFRESRPCHGYLALQSGRKEKDTRYDISLQYSTQDTYELEEGVMRQFSVGVGYPIKFYFYPQPWSVTTINIESPGFRSQIMLNVAHIQGAKYVESDFVYPTETQRDYFVGPEEEDLPGHKTIALDTSEKKHTLITMVIQIENAGENLGVEITDFFISCTSDLARIKESETLRGSVEDDKYQFYLFDKRDESPLRISVVAQHGNPDIYVVKDLYKRPTKEEHQLSSEERGATEFLEITKDMIYPQKELKGIWIIGIKGTGGSARYQISILSGDDSYDSIEIGQIMQMYLDAGKSAMLKYYHQTSDQEFTILPRILAGTLSIMVIPCESDNECDESAKIQYEIEQDFTEGIAIVANLKPVYHIDIFAVHACKFEITITKHDKYEVVNTGITMRKTVAPKKAAYYVFLVNEGADTKLQIDSYRSGLKVYASHNSDLNRTTAIWENTVDKEQKILRFDNYDYQSAPTSLKNFWNGKFESKSNPKMLYVCFENAGDDDISFSFVGLDDSVVAITLKDSHSYSQKLMAGGQFEGIYYSPTDYDYIQFNVQYIKRTKSETLQLDQSQLHEFNFQVYFAPSSSISSPLQPVTDIETDAIFSPYNIKEGLVYVKQYVNVKSRAGKYHFKLEGKGDFNKYASEDNEYVFVVSNTNSDTMRMKNNDWQMVNLLQKPKTIEIPYPFDSTGTALIDIMRCGGRIKMELSNDEMLITQDTLTSSSKNKIYKFTSEMAEVRQLELTNTQGSKSEIEHVLVHTSYFDNLKVLVDFDAIELGQILSFQVTKLTGNSANATVTLSPLKYTKDPTDLYPDDVTALYSIYLCPEYGRVLHSIECNYHFVEGQCTGEFVEQKLTYPGNLEKELSYLPFTPTHAVVTASIFVRGKIATTYTYEAKREGGKPVDNTDSGYDEHSIWDTNNMQVEAIIKYGGLAFLALVIIYCIYKKCCAGQEKRGGGSGFGNKNYEMVNRGYGGKYSGISSYDD